MAWTHGEDPYRLFNALDRDYRQLAHRHPCPACWSIRLRGQVGVCRLCAGRGVVEIPLDQPGARMLPQHPGRVRSFIYGAAIALREKDRRERPKL